MSHRIQDANDLKKELIKQLKNLKNKLDADLVTLHLYDADRDRVYFPVGINLWNKERFSRSVPSRKRVVGKIIRDREPIIANDALHHPDFTGPFTYSEGVKSGAGFPLIKNSEILGVIFVNYRQIHEFCDQDIQTVEDWTVQISEFLFGLFNTNEGQRLKTDLRRKTDLRTKEYRLLELTKQIREMLSDVDVVLWLVKPKQNTLNVSVSVGVDYIYTEDATFSLDETPDNFIASAYFEEEEKQEKNLKDKSRNLFNTDESLPWKRALAIPIQSEHHKLGVLCVLRRDRLDFTPRDLDELRTFARLMAVTIRNEDRIIIQNALHDLSMRMALSHDTEDILDDIARSAYEILDADFTVVHLYDPDRQEYLPLNNVTVYPESAREDMETPRSNGLTADIILNKQRFYVEDIDEEKNSTPLSSFVREQNIKAYVGLPLVSNQQSLGVLYVSFKQPRRFPPDELSLIQLLADNAATAIYNSRLFDESQQRAQRLELVRQVAADVSSALDLDEILQRAVDGLAKVFGVKQSAVAIFDESGEYSEVRAEYLSSNCVSAMGHRIPLKDNPQIEELWKTKKPLIVYDVQNDPNMENVRDIMAERKTLSMMIVPIIIGEEIVGTIGIDAVRSKRRFTEEEAELAMAVANQTAVAIHKFKLFQQREALQEIAYSITSELDRDTLLQKALERSLELLKCEFGSISVYDPKDEILVFKYAVGKSPEMHVALGEGLIGTAAQERRTIRVSDVSKDKRYVTHVKNTKSELDVPMLVEDRLVGVLNAESSLLDAFSKEDQTLAEALAAQVAVAFQKAESLQNRVNDIEALQNIYALIGVSTLEDILEQISEEAARLTPAKYAGIWLLNKKTSMLKFGAMNEAGEIPEKELAILPLDETSISAHVAKTEKTYRCDDVRDDPYYTEWYEDTRSQLTTPLYYGDTLIGILGCESTEIRAFTEDHQRLVEALAGAAAVAIHNAQMYERLEEQAKDRKVLNQLSQQLTRDIHLKENEILEILHSQASELMDTDNMYVARYDEVTDTVRFPLAYVDGETVEIETRKAGRGRTEEIIRTKEPIFHTTKEEASNWYAKLDHVDYLKGLDIKDKPTTLASWLGVPMVVGEKVLGVIATYHPDKDYVYSEDDLEILQVMANQVAIALDNTYMFYDVDQKRKALIEFSQKITSGIRLNENQILTLVHNQASELMDTDNMYIALYNDETDIVSFPLAFKNGKTLEIEKRKAGKGKTEEIIRTRKPIFHTTKEEASNWYAQPDHVEYTGAASPSWLGVPMGLGEKVLGVIATYHPTQDYVYSSDDLEILQTMADQAAIAIDNVRLVRQERERGEALKLLNQVSEKINATLNLNEVMASIVEGAMRLTGASSGVVHLLKENELSLERSFGYPKGFEHPVPRLDQPDSMTRTIIELKTLENWIHKVNSNTSAQSVGLSFVFSRSHSTC